jgi:hypothetical protein
MKKIFVLVQLTAVVAAYWFSSYAFGDGHGHGHHRHHHYQSEGGGYYPQPQANYYPQQPRDPRSHQGLAGGVVGSVLGYEIGNGSPVAAGLDAAAGSFLGNGMAGGRY